MTTSPCPQEPMQPENAILVMANAGHEYATASARWRAITTRDPCAHSSFLYGVTSTKIYCRPTCTARVARRANIVFYDRAWEAQRDGLRACQRCRPDDARFVGEREGTVIAALQLLRASHGGQLARSGVGEIASKVGVSASYLCRAFKRTMGVTMSQYLEDFERTSSSISHIRTQQSVDTVEAPPSVGARNARHGAAIQSKEEDWLTTQLLHGSPNVPPTSPSAQEDIGDARLVVASEPGVSALTCFAASDEDYASILRDWIHEP